MSDHGSQQGVSLFWLQMSIFDQRLENAKCSGEWNSALLRKPTGDAVIREEDGLALFSDGKALSLTRIELPAQVVSRRWVREEHMA